MLSCTVQGEEVGLVPHCTAEVLDILLEAMYVAWLCLLLLLVAVGQTSIRNSHRAIVHLSMCLFDD